jgi:hypothetical protein
MMDHLQITFTNIFRTREFNEQRQPDDFGAVSISLALYMCSGPAGAINRWVPGIWHPAA